MPTFEISAPDGRKFRIDAADEQRAHSALERVLSPQPASGTLTTPDTGVAENPAPATGNPDFMTPLPSKVPMNPASTAAQVNDFTLEQRKALAVAKARQAEAGDRARQRRQGRRCRCSSCTRSRNYPRARPATR